MATAARTEAEEAVRAVDAAVATSAMAAVDVEAVVTEVAMLVATMEAMGAAA